MVVYKVYTKGPNGAALDFITSYTSPTGQAIESYGLDFNTTVHVPVPSAELPPAPSVYGGLRKLTKLQWRKLLTHEEQIAFDRIQATVETMPLPNENLRDEIRTSMNKYKEATIMDLDDPDQARGFGMMVALGLMAPSRIQEILNG